MYCTERMLRKHQRERKRKQAALDREIKKIDSACEVFLDRLARRSSQVK